MAAIEVPGYNALIRKLGSRVKLRVAAWQVEADKRFEMWLPLLIVNHRVASLALEQPNNVNETEDCSTKVAILERKNRGDHCGANINVSPAW